MTAGAMRTACSGLLIMLAVMALLGALL